MAQNKSAGVKETSTTSLREAIKQWEDNNNIKISDVEEVKLVGLYPPLEKLDQHMQTLSHVQKLSLSTNVIEKLANFNNFRNLRVLSLGRNNIKSLSGLEAVGETLEQLWISHNLIEKLKGISALKELRVLYISCNLVKDWAEFMKLAELPALVELNFVGNPLEEKMTAEGGWREEVLRRLVSVQKLDGLPLIREVSDDVFREPLPSGTDLDHNDDDSAPADPITAIHADAVGDDGN
ncbi:dynein axonemal light chain 1 [Hyalella azteca]|uniref:Dynein axonemal light chain 1 n=1 Tax=Hyalella azteca TaxID=294128 RepID=A0A979FTG7_HYAAZ|nr:dynein axonemal light chain 1 [Hyalella azteca]